MKNYSKIIKDTDIFKLFFNKVPYIRRELNLQLRNDPVFQPACLYQESVHVLQAVEQFVANVKDRTLPKTVNLRLDELGHAEFDHSFLVYFKPLTFDHDMFDTDYLHLSTSWSYYKKFLDEDAARLPANTPLVVRVPPTSPEEHYRQRWLPSSFNEKKAKRLINYFLQLHQNPEYINKIEQHSKQTFNAIETAFTEFDNLLSLHQSVYIFIVDVHLVRTMDHVRSEPFGRFIEQVLKDRANILNAFLKVIPDALYAYTKLEHDYQNGLKLSCILILRNHRIDEEDIVARLQSLLRNEFTHYDDLRVINGNKFIRAHADKQAVGLIGVKTKERVESFKYWVLSYFFRIDDFARLIHPRCSFEINQSIHSPDWQRVDLQQSLKKVKKEPQIKNLMQILQELKLPNNIWGLGHLPQRIADRLLISHVYYKEFWVEKRLPQECADFLFQLEVFIETMLHNRYAAFNNILVNGRACDTKGLLSLSSQLGKQYLSIVKQVADFPHLFEQISQLIHQGGLYTWWFRGQNEQMLWLSFQQVFMKASLNSPIGQLVLNEFNQSIENARLNFTSQDQSFLTSRSSLEKHYGQCVKRHVETEEYLQLVMQKNCWLYRIVIEARSSKGTFKQSDLSKLFTEFMRLAKRAKPCYWLRGYLGIWQECGKDLPEFSLDVILFLNEKCQKQSHTVVYDLDQRWKTFLDKKAAKILEWETTENIKYFGNIKPKILMYSVERLNTEIEVSNTYHVCLEAYDRKLKKMIFQHAIPYFTYRDLFQAKFSQPVPKVLVKGAMLKKDKGVGT